MLSDLALYAELLIPLVGAFVYGFLSRELLEQPAILPGNRPVRLLALSLTLWYAGSLLDELAFILLPSSSLWTALGPSVDVLRSMGWLASFPLLAHTIARVSGGRSRASWLLLPGYASLAAFAAPAAYVLRSGEMVLTTVSREVYPLFVVHVTLNTVIATVFLLRVKQDVPQRDLVRFLRWLVAALFVIEVLVLAGALVLDVWAEPLWRILVSSSGLATGLTLLYFVRRYNLLSLSLSNRSLRHFTSILALLFLILVAGPAIGASGEPAFHRVLAFGFLMALLAGTLYGPLSRWAARRSPRITRWLGRSITPAEVAALTERLQNLELDEEDATREVLADVSRWTGTDARVLERSSPETALLWDHFEEPGERAFSRLRAPSPALAGALVAAGLHAAFPVRVASELEAILAVPASAVGGGYEDGEMESLELAVGRLADAIAIRRLLRERLDSERRLSERERLSMLGTVSASLAHELRNPLSSMKALAQTVHEEIARERPGSEQARDLDTIVEQVERLDAVAREILGFSRPGPESGSTALSALADSTVYVLDHEARRRGVSLDASGVERDVEVAGSPATWQTIAFNLVLNAIRHAPDGSIVRLRLWRADGSVTLECENQGPAIPPEVATRLFEPFVTGAADSGGTGLGLALVATRVGELGGCIALHNETDRVVIRVEVREHDPT